MRMMRRHHVKVHGKDLGCILGSSLPAGGFRNASAIMVLTL